MKKDCHAGRFAPRSTSAVLATADEAESNAVTERARTLGPPRVWKSRRKHYLEQPHREDARAGVSRPRARGRARAS